MIFSGDDDEPLLHGGDVSAARRRFPGAPEPFIDLSTGINPNPYPIPKLPPDRFARLPDAEAIEALKAAAARYYGAPSTAHVVPAPGSQILLPLVAGLAPRGKAAIVTPGYNEYARAASLAGHDVVSIRDIAQGADATLVMVGNPNNPDGRLFTRTDLLALAASLRSRNGILVVDEAFMDVGPSDGSLASEVGCGNVVVVRSFGKFFGLAGLRLGFAIAAPTLVARLRAMLGPWAVSGPAIAVGAKALADTVWIEQTRHRLEDACQRLDGLFFDLDIIVIGRTPLFRLVQTPAANPLFRHLGEAGIGVRTFLEETNWLRFGLPADRGQWKRVEDALRSFW
jgi:cobalamin biosynthesis protein CobC